MIFNLTKMLILEYPESKGTVRHPEEQKLYNKLHRVFDISNKIDYARNNTLFLTIGFHIIWFIFSLYGLLRFLNVTITLTVYFRTIAVMYIPSALGLIVFIYLTIRQKHLDYKADEYRKMLNDFRINNTKEE